MIEHRCHVVKAWSPFAILVLDNAIRTAQAGVMWTKQDAVDAETFAVVSARLAARDASTWTAYLAILDAELGEYLS